MPLDPLGLMDVHTQFAPTLRTRKALARRVPDMHFNPLQRDIHFNSLYRPRRR